MKRIIMIAMAWVLILGAAPALAGDEHPAAANDPTTPAVTAAKAWLDLIDQGKYGASWETAATMFKGAVERGKWEQTMTALRKPLGKTLSRKVASAEYKTSLPGAPDGEYVVIRFETSFTGKKNAIETVTPMKDSDGHWRVSGYYIK